jgi:hypothetical protein
VDNRLVIDRWRPPFEPQTRSAPVELKAGEKANIRVEYYNAGGKAAIQLLWNSASTPKQIIPQRYLYPEAETNKSAPADTNKETGMLPPPGTDAVPKATPPRPGEWLAIFLSGVFLSDGRNEDQRQSGNRFRWWAKVKDARGAHIGRLAWGVILRRR